MSFLTLNGVELSVRDGAPADAFQDAGEQVRAYSGNLLRDIIYRKDAFTFETTPLQYAEWVMWRWLLRGEGDVWHFDETGDYQWSAKGNGDNTEAGTVAETATAKFGGRAIDISAASSVTWADVLDGSGDWTALVWRDTGAGYSHYAETSSGLFQLDGSPVSTEGWFALSGGDLDFKLQNTGGSGVKFDDLVVMPFAATTAWLDFFFTNHATAWADLPGLRMAGDIIGSNTLLVQLENGSLRDKFLQASVSGTWDNALRNLTGRLVEE